MLVLPSRRRYSPEQFAEEFIATLSPGLIPRERFVAWDAIHRKLMAMSSGVEFFQELGVRLATGADLVTELSDCLLACDDPSPLVRCAFGLLGHTDDEFVTREDDFRIEDLSKAIREGDERRARQLAEMLQEVGLSEILIGRQVADVAMGVQVGLETHRRKNVGGDAFRAEMERMVNSVCGELKMAGVAMEAKRERSISYEGGSKTVDFVLSHEGAVRFGIEGNFYTVAGSKPTEIKRSYADLAQRLDQVGVTLIWLTDGKGYRRMRSSLRDAFAVFRNIYNLRMAADHLASDLLAVVRGL